MAGREPARGGLRETMAEFVDRRWRDAERLGQDAEAAARDAYGRAIRMGEDLILKTQSEVERYGASLAGAKRPPARAASTVPRSGASHPASVRSQASQPTARASGRPDDRSWLDRSSAAKAAAGEAARVAGFVPGAARGVWHTVEGAVDGVNFVSRLLDPFDAEHSPRGEAAWDQVFSASKGVADYASRAFSEPKIAADDIGEGLSRLNARTDPRATPVAETFGGEVRRNFDIGLNRGELAADVGLSLYGGGAAKKLISRRVSEAEKAAGYVARGYPSGTAAYFATPYGGIGHHTVGRRSKFPAMLGGGPVHPVIVESSLLRLKPRNTTCGDFFELHYGVDGFYRGGKVPRRFGGGGWSGEKLGWRKFDPLERVWYGTTPTMKATAGAGVAGAGALVDEAWDEEQAR